MLRHLEKNIYCDESTHIENDGMPFLVIGAITCPKSKAREVAVRIREIKAQHGLNPKKEIKWTKVSPSKVDFYLQLVDYFLAEPDLKFRAVVASKDGLDHAAYGNTHDDWYYRIYYYLLRALVSRHIESHIYLDIKDTQSSGKVAELWKVLAYTFHDFDRDWVKTVQVIRSHDSELMQLADVLIGAVNYRNRGLDTSKAKTAVVERLQQSTVDLTKQTSLGYTKVNIFPWTGRARP